MRWSSVRCVVLGVRVSMRPLPLQLRRIQGPYQRSSFRDAPLGPGPESILPIVVMDSGLALRAPRNDGNSITLRPRQLIGVKIGIPEQFLTHPRALHEEADVELVGHAHAAMHLHAFLHR